MARGSASFARRARFSSIFARTVSAAIATTIISRPSSDLPIEKTLTRPGAAFAVVAVSPTRGTATMVQLAQTAAHRHAQEVMRTMTDMGVLASRLTVASATDPMATTSEVRVFVR